MLSVVLFLSIPSVFPEFVLPLMSSSSLWQGKWRKKEILDLKKEEFSFFAPKGSQKWPILRTQTGLRWTMVTISGEVVDFYRSWGNPGTGFVLHWTWFPLKVGKAAKTASTESWPGFWFISVFLDFISVFSDYFHDVNPLTQIYFIYLLCKSFKQVICSCNFYIISVWAEHYQRIPSDGKKGKILL